MSSVTGESADKRSNSIAPLLALMTLVFVLLGMYTMTHNTDGDGKFHTLYAKTIVETGDLLESQPYEIMRVEDGQKVMMPIPYPETFHVMVSLFYMVGGDAAVKMVSPILGMLTAAFAYLLLRRFSRYGAFAAAALAILLNTERFIMVPLMEQLLLLATVAGLYFYYRAASQHSSKYLIAAGFFLGLAIATKQQGLIFFGVVILHAVITSVIPRLNRGKSIGLRNALIIVVIAVITGIPALIDQIQRNGTLEPVPGETTLPFFQNKYPQDDAASEELTYNILHHNEYSPTQAVEVYILSPLFFTTSVAKVLQWEDITTLLLSLLLSVVYIAGIRYLLRRDAFLASLLGLLLLIEILVTYQANTHPDSYHNLGLLITGIFFVLGLIPIVHYLSERRSSGIMGPAIVAAIISAILISYFAFGAGTLRKYNGRFDDRYLKAYSEMGQYVQANTPENAVVLTGGGSGTGFGYYSKRKTLWINEGGNAEVPLIFRARDPAEAKYWIDYYGIDYVFIDWRQTSYPASCDSIPPSGLVDFINDSPAYFSESLGCVDGDKELISLYEVIS